MFVFITVSWKKIAALIVPWMVFFQNYSAWLDTLSLCSKDSWFNMDSWVFSFQQVKMIPPEVAKCGFIEISLEPVCLLRIHGQLNSINGLLRRRGGWKMCGSDVGRTFDFSRIWISRVVASLKGRLFIAIFGYKPLILHFLPTLQKKYSFKIPKNSIAWNK